MGIQFPISDKSRGSQPQRGWLWGVVCALGMVGGLGTMLPGMAQVTPDGTLGAEPSRVVPMNPTAERIEGGALRGVNLFHSFLEFNVGAGRGVYFANPAVVQNIFSRVTGGNVSNINGTLGVLGNANLYLLNPNGIIFGPSARLDIAGSFFASTASGFTFPDGSEFSATNPQAAPLLTVSLTPGLQRGGTPGAIANAGNLTVGKDLTLSGGTVTSTGLLAAPQGQLTVEATVGDARVRDVTAQTATLYANNNLILEESQLRTTGDLNLLAQNTVRVRDSVANPFVAWAGGKLLVQGNQSVDIFALNHPASELISGGDMVLRSANAVGGDAHYWTGGKFRIEQLDGDLGSLHSPYDPVIRAIGDVEFKSYLGSSLHILAGGSVRISGQVQIVGEDSVNGLVENIPLSDGKTSILIDGRNQATLDVRAGVSVEAIGNPLFTPTPFPGRNPRTGSFADGSFLDNEIVPDSIKVPDTKSSADIKISRIYTYNGQEFGQVFLTNQYKPNLKLEFGSIEFHSVDAKNFVVDSRDAINIPKEFLVEEVNAGSIFLISKNDINVLGSTVGSVSEKGNAGDVRLLAGRDINVISGGTTDNQSVVSSVSYKNGSNSGKVELSAGRDINIVGIGGINETTSSVVGSATVKGGIGGDVSLVAERNVFISGGSIATSPFTDLPPGVSGKILIESKTGEIKIVSTSKINSIVFPSGGAGAIEISTPGDITIDSSVVATLNLSEGGASPLKITAGGKFKAENGALIASAAEGLGSGGQVQILAKDINFSSSGIGASSIDIISSLTPENQSRLLESGFKGSGGNAGRISVIASDSISLDNSFFNSDTQTSGNGGEIFVGSGRTLSIIGSTIVAKSLGSGNAGDIQISVGGNIRAKNSSISTIADKSSGGTVSVSGRTILLDNSDVTTFLNSGINNAGNITLDARAVVALGDSNILAFAKDGRGGNITFNTPVFVGYFYRPSPPGTDFSTFFGNGRVDINATGAISSGTIILPDVDPSQGLVPLPTGLEDPSKRIDTTCASGSGKSSGQFVITGRGGLPPNPSDPLTPDATLPPQASTPQPDTRSAQSNSPSEITSPGAIVEAQGFVRLANGRIRFVAQSSTVTPHSPWQVIPDCSQQPTANKSKHQNSIK